MFSSRAATPPLAAKKTGFTVGLSALLVAGFGLVNLWSALLARGVGRAEFLRETAHVPLVVEHGTRTLTALFGLLLLMLARSLGRRKQQAWRITVGLLFVAPFLHLAKGLDWEEAALCIVLLGGLLIGKPLFDAANDPPSARQGIRAALALLAFAAGYGPVGFVLLAREFTPRPGARRALVQTAHLLVHEPDEPVLRPRTRRAAWFEDSLILLSAFAGGYAVFMLLRPVLPRGERATAAERACARALLRAHGGPPLACFTLLPDKRYLFPPARGGGGENVPFCWAVAYVVVGRRAVALGDPLGDPARAAEAIAAFVAHCRARDWAPAFYQTTARHRCAYRQTGGLRLLRIGEDALLDLPGFSLSGKRFQDLRTTQNKMKRLGISCAEWEPGDAEMLTQMASIFDNWLRGRHGEEKTFALGGFDPAGDLFRDSRVFVAAPVPTAQASDAPGSRAFAFVTFVPIHEPGGAIYGWGLDLMRRADGAPSGVMEFLIASAAQQFQQEGARVMSLGLAPLAAQTPASGDEDAAESATLAHARRLLFERAGRFYAFRGLHAFKEKFGPRWESRYLAYPSAAELIPTILAVLRAHSPRAGLWTFLRTRGSE